jgi:hypothetical protein
MYIAGNQVSSVGIVTRLWAGKSGVWFLVKATSGLALGSKKPPVHGVSGTLSAAVKRPEHEADHAPPCNAKFKNDQC